MPDRWNSRPIACLGGLVLDQDSLTQGTQFPGTARTLQNFEPDISGGYRRVSGTTKYDSAAVTGGTNNPILGVKVALGGVFACRKNSGATDNAIYYSNGAGWTKVNTTLRPGAVVKARFTSYSLVEPVVIQCDGVNPAWKWNGATEVTLNSAGAPANPKGAKLHRGRLALYGYGAGDLLTLSAPNDDEDYSGGAGALEFNVGDTIKGMALFRDELIIFCARSIKKLSGSTSADFAIVPVSDSIGCVSGDTIQELGGDLVYLSPDGLRSYAATERFNDVELGLISRSIQPIVAGILQSGLSEDEYSSCVIRRKSQYRLFLNNPDLDSADNLNILGRLQDSPTTPHGQFEWATLVGIKPFCSDSEYSDNLERAVFGDPTNGYVYTLESGNTFDGTNIQAIYRTPDLTFDDAAIRKVFHKLYINTQIEGDVAASVQLLLEKGSVDIIQPGAKAFGQTGGVPTYGVAVYDTDVYGAFVYPNFKTNLIGSGFFGAFQFVCNNDSAPFRIESFIIQLAIKGRR